MFKQIPNFFTLANLFFGCCAIVFILQSGETLVHLNTSGDVMIYLPEQMWFGGVFIFAAAVMDFLDGFVARLLKVTSPLGVQLDSLSDVVSFGVAPAMILFQLLRIAFAHQFDGINSSWFLLSPAFFVACFAAYRLGKFNLDTRQTTGFIGMPTPAMAMFVAALPLVVWKNYFHINSILLQPLVLYGIVFSLCFLMVSEIPFFSLKLKTKTPLFKIQVLFLVISALLLVFFQWFGIVLCWILYVLLNLLFTLKKQENLS